MWLRTLALTGAAAASLAGAGAPAASSLPGGGAAVDPRPEALGLDSIDSDAVSELAVMPSPCVWPDCASECPPCSRSGGNNATSCLLTFPGMASCPLEFKCVLGRCMCYSGFCYEGGRCAKRQCITGAKPKAFVPSRWVYRFNQFAPPGAPSTENSSHLRWVLYWCVAWITPILLMVVGSFTALGVMNLLVKGPDMWLCRRVPRVPVFLPIWATLTLVMAGHGFVRRSRFVALTSEVVTEQLLALRKDMVEVLDHGNMLLNTTTTFQMNVHAIPESCVLQESLAPMMVKVTHAVDRAVNSTVLGVHRLSDVLQAIPARIDSVLWYQGLMDIFIEYFPVIPTIVETCCTIFIVVVAFLSFYSPNPKIAERAVRGLKRYGSWVFAGLILLSTFMAAIYLHTALVTSRFCEHVDGNVLGWINNMDYSQFAQGDEHQVGEDMRGAARYYVSGKGSNPIGEVVANIKSNVDTLAEVRNSTMWLEDLSSYVCPAVGNLKELETRTQMTTAVTLMMAKLQPRNIWPYYDVVVHKTYCWELPRRIFRLIFFNCLLSFVMMPILAITLDVDLKRMVAYKSGHGVFEEQSDDDDDDSEEEHYRAAVLAKSSPSYTHVTPTVMPKTKPGAAGGKAKTFLA